MKISFEEIEKAYSIKSYFTNDNTGKPYTSYTKLDEEFDADF